MNSALKVSVFFVLITFLALPALFAKDDVLKFSDLKTQQKILISKEPAELKTHPKNEKSDSGSVSPPTIRQYNKNFTIQTD